MVNLEKVIRNTAKGIVAGGVNVVDPLGSVVSEADHLMTGSGFASDRGITTVHNNVYRKLYPEEYEEERGLNFNDDYVPRFVGTALGGAALALGGVHLYLSSGPVAALAIPALAGLYDVAMTIDDYFNDFSRGERVDGERSKANFGRGFLLGFNETTNPGMIFFHGLENLLTGRSLDKSHVKSSIKNNANGMRRNAASLLGYFTGGVVGLGADIVTLGILPVYNTARDMYKNFTGEDGREHEDDC